MTGRKKVSFVISVVCLLSLCFWFYYWLFIAPRDSGLRPNVAIVNHPDGSQSFPVTYDYDAAQRYAPYVPLMIGGAGSALMASVIAGIVSGLNKRSMRGDPLVIEILVSVGTGVLSTVAFGFAIGFVWFAFFDHSPFAPQNPEPMARGLAMLILLPGLCIYSGIPALLSSVGTTCLLDGFCQNSRH